MKSTIARHGEVSELLAGCDAIAAHSGDNHLPLMWRFYRSHRAVLFRFARTVHFEATMQDRALLAALQIVLAHEGTHGDWLPATVKVNLSFESEQWQRTILVRTDSGRRIARRHFEVCVFSNLATGLKSGDVAIRASDAYADYRGQLRPNARPESPTTAGSWGFQPTHPRSSPVCAHGSPRLPSASMLALPPTATPGVSQCSGAGPAQPHHRRPGRLERRCSIAYPSAACGTSWLTSTSGLGGYAISGRCPDVSGMSA